MAIETYYFSAIADETENTNELYTYLTENAADYFGDISQNASARTVTAKAKNGSGYAAFSCVNSGHSRIFLNNGIGSSQYSATGMIVRAYKTSHGILLLGETGVTGNLSGASIFIAKTNENTTGCLLLYSANSNANAFDYVFADLDKSNIFYYTFENRGLPITASTRLAVKNFVTQQADMTSLANVVFPGGTYATGLYFMPFFEHSGHMGIFTKGGVQYVTDGAFALKE